MKLPHVNKKPLATKWIFVQTPFSHSTFNLEQKIFTPQNLLLFRSAWPKSLLQFDSKNHENLWTDLKKKTASQYNSNSLNCKKNQENANNIPSYRCAAINNEIFQYDSVLIQSLYVHVTLCSDILRFRLWIKLWCFCNSDSELDSDFCLN